MTCYGGAFRTVDLWDMEKGGHLRKYSGIAAAGAKFSRDSSLLACFAANGEIRIWRTDSDRVVWTSRDTPCDVSAVAFFEDSTNIVLGCADGTIMKVDFRAGDVLGRVPGHSGAVKTIELSPDGRLMLTGGSDEALQLWRVADFRAFRRLGGHRGNVTAGRFFPGNEYVLSGSQDGTMKIWRTSTGRCYRTIITPDDKVSSCAISADGRHALSGGTKGSVRLWSLDTGWFEREFLDPAISRPRTFRELAREKTSYQRALKGFLKAWKSADVREAVDIFEKVRSMPGYGWTKEAVQIRNVLGTTSLKGGLRSWSFIRGFRGHEDAVVSVAASPDGFHLLTGSLDGTAAVWDVFTGRRLALLRVKRSVEKVLFLQDGQGVLTWSEDALVRRWDLKGQLVGEHDDVYPPLLLNGASLLAMDARKIPISIHLDTGAREPLGPVISAPEFLCYSGNGKTLYSLRDGGRIQIWDQTTALNTRSLRDLGLPVTALCPSDEDDRVIVGLGNGEITVYVVGSGVNMLTLRGHTSPVRSVCWGRSRNVWVSGSDDCSLRVWDLDTQSCLAVMEGHSSPVRAVSAFPNASMVASGGNGGNVRLWGLDWEVEGFT